MLLHKSKSNQQIQHLFNNSFTENKPIPFPEHNKHYAYSSLFYWAHLVAHESAEFPLHGHKGFEIMTFVLKGSLEHFDTATNVWTPIKQGGFQVIQAGGGVMHSERIVKGSEVFQIWFDPDFSKTLKTDPIYKDYTEDNLSVDNVENIKAIEYIGTKSDIKHQTTDISIRREFFQKGTYTKMADISYVYSIYVMEGKGSINKKSILKDDFIVIDDTSSFIVDAEDDLELFIIKSPKVLPYPRVNI